MMIVIAYLLSFSCLILNGFLFLRLKPPYSFMISWFPQLFAGALSPFLIIVGLAGAALGWLSQAPIAVAAGALGAGISAFYFWQATIQRQGFAEPFGPDWQSKLTPRQTAHMLKRRWNPGLPRTGEPRFEQNIAFWTIPGSDRELLCDLWQPPDDVAPSGLAVIYFFGSGWYLSDKDFGTRPFFRQLAGQGHVVMDVAYRLVPEVDIYGMVGDVKRAMAWMKENGERYGVNPERIVLAGGSAGGHLSLLAAYAPTHPQLNPADVQGRDLSARAVISYYGPTDLRAVYNHTHQERLVGLPKVEIGQPGAATMQKKFQGAGRIDALVGGHPDEVPEVYDLASPIAHVHPNCPPTLLIQGELDCIAPPAAARELHRTLTACGVPSINIIYPLTNHAFDLVLPEVSPSAQAAIYEIERFLALMI